MLKKIVLFTVITVIHITTWAMHNELSNPNVVVKHAVSDLFNKLETKQSQLTKNPNYYKVIIEEELSPYIDFKYAAYRVLGREISTTTEEQREHFAIIFKKYMISSFAQAFVSNYHHQHIQFLQDINYNNEKVVSIMLYVVDNDNKKIAMSFLLRKNKQHEWKIFDLIVENISSLSSQQSDITFSIRKHGFDFVVNELQKKADIDISASSK